MKKYTRFSEAKQVGVLYHFTSINYLESIVLSNYVLKSGTSIKQNSKRIPVISFTRDFNLKNTFLISTECRIAVNGNKLSERYKIQPYADYIDDYKKEREEILIGKQADIKKAIIQIDIMYTEKEFEDFFPQKYKLFVDQKIEFNFVSAYRKVNL